MRKNPDEEPKTWTYLVPCPHTQSWKVGRGDFGKSVLFHKLGLHIQYSGSHYQHSDNRSIAKHIIHYIHFVIVFSPYNPARCEAIAAFNRGMM